MYNLGEQINSVRTLVEHAEGPDGPCKRQGAIFTLDSATGLCTAVERVDIR